MSRSEHQSFQKFAPLYFQYMQRAIVQNKGTLLAKILGVFEVRQRNSVTNKTAKQFILVIENLFYDRKISRIFDLKGSMRSRYAQSTGQESDVLLDQNLIEGTFVASAWPSNMLISRDQH